MSPEGMLDLLDEHAHLAWTDTQISEGERRTARQIACLEYCRRAGHETAETEGHLHELEDQLATWPEHRAEILRRIERQDAPALSAR